jgi:hypothetical protein
MIGRRTWLPLVHVSGKFAVKFWNDFADHDVKILNGRLADLSS